MPKQSAFSAPKDAQLSKTTESAPKDISGPSPVSTPSTTTSKPDLLMRPGFLSLLVFFFIGLSAFMAIMWMNEKQAGKMAKTSMEYGKDAPAAMMEKDKSISMELPPVKPIGEVVELPEPNLTSSVSVEETLASRRSRREYADQAVTLEELGQVLWSAQGITDDVGHRAAPSAKGAYPYTLYVVVRNVENLEPGFYQYEPDGHTLGSLGLANAGDLLIEAEVQENSQTAPVVVVMAAAGAKMIEKFPDSDPAKNVYLEGGHIGQNIYLQVESLGMSTVVTGGFNPKAVGDALQLHSAEEVVYLVPFGHTAPAIEEPEEE